MGCKYISAFMSTVWVAHTAPEYDLDWTIVVSGVRLELIKLVNVNKRSFMTSQFLLISEHAHINIQLT